MSTKEQRRQRQSSLRGMKYAVDTASYHNNPSVVDANTSGQYAKAAQVLLREYANVEAVRNTPEVLVTYAEEKRQYHGNAFESGRSPVSETPPHDWPLPEEEWKRVVGAGVFHMLDQALAYGLFEKERLTRQHYKLKEHGTSGVDDLQVARLKKTRKKEQSVAYRNWRARLKQKEENPSQPLTAGQAYPTPYVGLSDAAMNNAYDATMSNAYDSVVELNFND